MRRSRSSEKRRVSRKGKAPSRRRYVHRTSVRNKDAAQWSFRVIVWTLIFSGVIFGSIRGYIALRDTAMTSEHLKISSINFEGGKNILRGEIIPLLPFDLGDHMLFQDIASARKKILELKPELKDIQISRGWESVNIRATERVPVAVVRSKDGKLGIDYDNKVFPLRGAYSNSSFPEIVSNGEVERREILDFVRLAAQKAPDLLEKTEKIYIKSVDTITLELSEGYKIYWGRCEKSVFPVKLKRYKQVINDSSRRFEGVEYINLSFLDAGRVLIKPKVAGSALSRNGGR